MIPTNVIIEAISQFKAMQDALKFEKEEAKKRSIEYLKNSILQKGEEVKEFLKVCNHLAKCGYYRKSSNIPHKMSLYIDGFNLLDGGRLDVYTESSVITDITARCIGNSSIKTSGDAVITHPNFSHDDADELIKQLKQFSEDLDRTLKMFYLNLGDKLNLDLMPNKSPGTDIDKICQAAGLTKIDDVITKIVTVAADIEKR